jgi:hypothetical protein
MDPDVRKLAQQREEAGGWIRWLEEHVAFKRTQAHAFITVFNEMGGTDVRTSEHLGVDALYLISTLPPDERTREHTLKSGTTIEGKIPNFFRSIIPLYLIKLCSK